MVWDAENQHGQPEQVTITAPDRPQRPLTTDEKLAPKTQIDLDDAGLPSSPAENDPTGVCNNAKVEQTHGILSQLRHLEAVLDRKLGVEAEAIDRKLPEDRKPQPWHAQLNMALLWASGTLNVSCFTTGLLGWELGLSLKQSILIVVFGSVLGGAVSGFCATMGAATGLRQISIGRYSMGWWPNRIVAALNTVQQVGWGVAGCITGGLALAAVSDGGVSIVPGIIIIACCSLAISFLGLRAILAYEKYAWLVYFIVFLVIFGETGRYADDTSPASVKGADLSGAVLSFLAIVYGSSASWAPIASDYYVHYAVDVNRTKVFFMTTFGIAISASIGMMAGCVVGSAMNNRPDWKESYENQGLGFLIRDMLYPSGFAKFILVLLVLSGINMNVLSTYSAGLSCQQFSRPFSKIPRFIWTILCFGVIVALALAGRNDLLTYLQNFLSLLGYWCTSYAVIVFTEHYLFRKGKFANYDLEGWNDPSRLPLGIAGFTAFALGVVAWVMGMVQTWYVGPLGKLIGASGGDVSNEFTLVVTASSYIPMRHMELKYFGR